MEANGNTAVAARHQYLWEVPGKPVSARLEIDFVDRLLMEIMRGFGVVPRRGVEMGGILLGSVQSGPAGKVVLVEDFEPVACQHAKGPAWLLSEDEQIQFEDTLARWAPAEGKRTYAVGFYRSHTREGLGMTPEDEEMYRQYFRDPSAITLLVKPFATRTSVGAIFFREGETCKTDVSYEEFPFHPRELAPEYAGVFSSDPEPRAETPPPARPAAGASPKPSPAIRMAAGPPVSRTDSNPSRPAGTKILSGGSSSMGSATSSLFQESKTSDQLQFGLPVASQDGKGRHKKTGWVWIPLSFIFVIVGVLLGMLVSETVGARLQPATPTRNPYTLGVSVAPSGEGLLFRWDRGSPAIENATGGELVIKDGAAEKTVPLDALQLRTGSVIYRNASPDVTFRLSVNTSGSVTLSESSPARK
ncbi:MAG: hypothetical protein R2729_16425 [Bryobacteraceae bacterium]